MLNSVNLQGRLVADPELKHTNNDIAFINATIATDRSYSGNGEKVTDFHDIVAWRHSAEFINKYFGKGDMILISGELQTRNWEDKQGNKRKSVEVMVKEVNFCGGKSKDNDSASTPAPAKATRKPKAPEPRLADFVECDDDLPF